MAEVSVPKDLDRVNKSMVWFWIVHELLCGLCDVVLFPWVNNMLIVVLWAVPRWMAGLNIVQCEPILCYCYE